MRAFADLYDALDATTSTNAKVAALASWLLAQPPLECAWATFFLTGGRLKRVVGPRLLATWALEETGTPAWLFEECYSAVGDLSETLALLMAGPGSSGGNVSTGDITARALSAWIGEVLRPLAGVPAEAQRPRVVAAWRELPRRELYLFNKLLTGELRVGVSATLAIRAVAQAAGLSPQVIAGRLAGSWEPSAEAWERLVAASAGPAEAGQPYPFFLAAPLEDPPSSLGPREEWQAEWKWDGIRAQLVKRAGRHELW